MDPFDDLDDEEEEEQQKKNVNLLTVAGALGKLAGTEEFADIRFLVGTGKAQRSIPAHRVLLAASSDVFEAMLYPPLFPGDPEVDTGGVGPNQEIPEIELPDVDPAAFRSMLKSLYSDAGEITAEELPHLIYIAKKFQLEGLRQACTNFMESGVTAENCCTLLHTARELVEEREFVLQFVEQNFEAVLLTPGWLSLDKEEVRCVLASDRLGAEEVAVFAGVLKWAAHHCPSTGVEGSGEERRKVLDEVISLIRFPCMTLEDIANVVCPSGVLNAHQLLRIFTYLGTEEKARSALPEVGFPTKPRVAQSNLKWTLDPKLKSGTAVISAGNLKVTTSGSSSHAFALGNTLFLAGKYAWQVTRAVGDSHPLLLGVSAKKQFADNSQSDKLLWAINSANQGLVGGAATAMSTNFNKGPLQCLLDCEAGTFAVVNLSTHQKWEIKDLPKKEELSSLEGGGLVPHLGFFNVQEVTVQPIHIGKFGKRVL